MHVGRAAGILLILAGLVVGLATLAVAAPSRPFPRHVSYVAGTILPNHTSRAVLDQSTRAFYDVWKATFVRAGCGSGRYYIALDGRSGTVDGATALTVSEGIGLGMLIVPYMAGYDPAARTIFDGLYLFARDHPSQHDADLMAWRQMGGCASSGDPNSASDGDLNIAFGLLLAHTQWGSTGAIDYRAAALRVLAAIQRQTIHPTTGLVQMGDWVQPDYPLEYDAVRMSDLMPMQLRAFANATGLQAWLDTRTASLGVLKRMQQNWAPTTGLVPEFAVNTPGQARPADPGFLGEPRAAQFAFNSCRVPWQIAIDYLLNGNTNSAAAVAKMMTWLQSAAGTDVYRIFGGYYLNGTPAVNWNYVGFTGSFGVAAMTDARYQTLLNNIWNDVAVTSIGDPTDYYGSTLRMVYLLAMSGNLWRP